MTCQDNELLLNSVLIQMARSFLQYVAEASPWVRHDALSLESQVLVLAARQRQDVAEIARLLESREFHIDFGSFPTEYTDQQFLSLQSIIGRIESSHALVCRRIEQSAESLRTGGDAEAAALLTTLLSHERDILRGLAEVRTALNAAVAVA